ncbi:hypothetical protein BGW37DRAFT_465595 [Umbelopsis sp. PMI_123]|nr:hypothetical protein BGW37DRAFT_465595 [Umbelopsis sp. PMI_123]
MDRQFRNFDTAINTEANGGNGYTQRTFQLQDSVITSTTLFASQNLIIDKTETPGLGILNVTIPYLQNGGNWTELVLWVEPVTECVDLNVTYDFVLRDTSPSSPELELSNISITDRGGFANFNINNYQPNQPSDRNINLEAHAYQAANYALRTDIGSFNINSSKIGTAYAEALDFSLSNIGMALADLDYFSEFSTTFNLSVGAGSSDSYTICGRNMMDSEQVLTMLMYNVPYSLGNQRERMMEQAI